MGRTDGPADGRAEKWVNGRATCISDFEQEGRIKSDNPNILQASIV